ncbi:MAG: DUF1501 domain-containing protein [Planctomycetaceae bacterium]|nr:DUF1501 domain-containing protein [Planctomycetaceae bacterium]
MSEQDLSRRALFGRLGGGVGTVALASLLFDSASVSASEATGKRFVNTHHAPRAKRVIQLFMNGGPFQADFFDPKPAINQFAGQRPKEVEFRTENKTGGLMPVPNGYRPRGESGLPVSDLLPQIGECIDDICVIRSLHCDNPNHGPALFQMNNGTITPTRPSMGSWMLYGLGSENADLPGYVVLCPGRPVRFAELWSSAFLPGENQGTYINHTDLDPAKLLPNLRSSDASLTLTQQRRQLELLRRINAKHLEQHPDEPALEARIRSMETAFRMQFAASEAFDIRLEPEPIREEYGKSHYAHGCLMARRLIERGVRFVQVYYGNGQPWDTHSNHDEQVKRLARDIDQPTAALLRDLKRRGLLEDTLVIWGGEFGRTSTTEGSNGRDHNHLGFTTWLAGGGVRGGTTYGATDDFAFRAVQDKVHVHDLHATILHLLGFNHEHLTYRHAGRDFRLTDVYGRVVNEILA